MENEVDCTNQNIRGMLILEFQLCHTPIPCCSLDNGFALVMAENQRSSRTGTIFYVASITCLGKKVANSRPWAIDMLCKNRYLFKDMEKHNLYAYFHISHFSSSHLWPVARN